ncbi:MAG: type IV pilus assembly protein PilM [Planctomycetota bacterium]|jgi:type IV pilus assembly protein PilM
MASVWGIDIGRRAVKGVRFHDTSAGPMLDTADSVDVELTPNPTDSEKDEAMRIALATFIKRHRIRGESVFVSIPGHTTFNRVLRVPVVDEKKLDSTIRFEAQQQIPFPIEEVVWDYHPLPRLSPTEMEISLFAVKNDFIRKFLHNMELVGLMPAGIQIAPLALFNFARYELDMRGANLILDLGSDATDLLVLDQDKTWMRTVPLAGNDVTKALADKFKLPFEEAEKLKIKSGSSKQAQKIFGVMKPILNDLVTEVDRSLSYYRSQVPDVEFKECLLLGSGGKLVGIRKYLREALEVDVTRVSGLKKVQVGPKLNLEFLQANLAGLPVAMGLALQGLGKADNNVNFLPRPLVEAREVRRQRPWLVAAVLILLIGVFAGWRGMDTFRGEYDAALEKAQILNTFKNLQGELDRLKDDEAEREWIRNRAALSLGRDGVATAHEHALAAIFPEKPEKDRPAMWILSAEITPSEDGVGWTARVTGAMDNVHRGDLEALGPLPEGMTTKTVDVPDDWNNRAVSELRELVKAILPDQKEGIDAWTAEACRPVIRKYRAYQQMRSQCELDIKSLVLDPLKALGCCSTDPTKGLQTKGTFVNDLALDVHKGTRFYRFMLEWTYAAEE